MLKFVFDSLFTFSPRLITYFASTQMPKLKPLPSKDFKEIIGNTCIENEQ